MNSINPEQLDPDAQCTPNPEQHFSLIHRAGVAIDTVQESLDARHPRLTRSLAIGALIGLALVTKGCIFDPYGV